MVARFLQNINEATPELCHFILLLLLLYDGMNQMVCALQLLTFLQKVNELFKFLIMINFYYSNIPIKSR